MKIYDKRYFYYLFACFAIYLTTIAVKMCYSSQMVSMMEDFNVSKAEISAGLTVYYFIYAAAQIALAPYVKRINMRNFLLITSFLSGISFGCMFFCRSLWQVWFILALNGILQSGVYGGFMFLFGKYLPDGMSEYVTNVISLGLPLGTALSYGVSAFFVAFLSWRHTFLFFAVLSLISIFVYLMAERRVKVILHETVSATPPKKKDRIMPKKHGSGMLMFYIIIASFFVSAVYYGLTNWVPNLLKEVHGMPAQYSILVTLLLPICMMPGPIIATRSCEKHRNYFGVGAVFAAFTFALSLLLLLFYRSNIVVAMVLSALVLLFLRGGLNLLCTYIPLVLKKRYDAGRLSMLSNAIACIGAGAIPYVTGKIMDAEGGGNWDGYYVFLAVFGGIALISLLFAARYLKKAQKQEEAEQEEIEN